jgi:hypothetical protein
MLRKMLATLIVVYSFIVESTNEGEKH